MKQSWIWKLLLSMGLLGAAIYLLVPTFIYFTLDAETTKKVRRDKNEFAKHLPWWSLTSSHIVPGLDLQGGIHLELGVDVEKAIENRTARAADRLMGQAKDNNVAVTKVSTEGENKDTTILVSFANATDRRAFYDKILPLNGDLQRITETDTAMQLRLLPEIAQNIKRDAVAQTINTINTRINKLGVTEPSVNKSGEDQISIQLPGLEDPEEAKALIGRTAQLQFQMLDDQADFLKTLTDLPAGVAVRERSMQLGRDIFLEFAEKDLETVKAYLKGKVPDTNTIKFGRPVKDGDNSIVRSYTLHRKIDLTGEDLVDVRVDMDTRDGVGVGLSFTPSGGKIFEKVSGDNIGREFAIVLEDSVDNTPVFKSKIPAGNGGRISMSSGRTKDQALKEAKQLELVLKSGALPAPVSFRNELTVGPTLGQESVDNASKAFGWGALLIILFMMIYYRVAGFISVLGMIINVVFILAAMAVLGATITLPGVAGLLLTMGMAVDTNVIINERIREELRLGKMPRSAVKAGYEAAFSAVIDSHVTTLIGGTVLYFTGSGPVANFAAFLLIGTVFSLFTGVFVTRIFFEALTSRGPKTLSI